MGSLMRVIILVAGFAFAFTVFFLLSKKKINERNTLVWLAASVGIFIFSAFPELLDWFAHKLGVSYPPSLLFLFSALLLLIVVLYQSMQISGLNEKVKQLSQYVALLSVEENQKGDDNETIKSNE